jgi:hypothetical protein
MVVIIEAIYQHPPLFFSSLLFFFLNAGCQQPIFMHIYCTGYIDPVVCSSFVSGASTDSPAEAAEEGV